MRERESTHLLSLSILANMNNLLLIDEMYRLSTHDSIIIFTGSVRGVHLILVLTALIPVSRGQVGAVAEEWKIVTFEGHVFGWGAYAVAGAWWEVKLLALFVN